MEAWIAAVVSPVILSLIMGYMSQRAKAAEALAVSKAKLDDTKSLASIRQDEARIRREEKNEDWLRLDKVAEQAAVAARLNEQRQDRIEQQAAQAAALLLERQDAIAAEAAEVARLNKERQDAIASQAEEAARLLLANNRAVATTTSETQSQLKVIHTLVNANMTSAIQSEYDAIQRELAMMREVIELRKANGQDPTQATLDTVVRTEEKIVDLANTLAERHAAQQQVDSDSAPTESEAAPSEAAPSEVPLLVMQEVRE